jgi:hypothetical protein
MDAAADGTPLVSVVLDVTVVGEAAGHVICAGGRCHVPEPAITVLTATLPVRPLATLTALPVIRRVTASTPLEPASR